jgi:hypothetical protein
MAYKFFIYPKDRNERPLMFAMQPSWNLDREGNGSAEQQEKYDALTAELDAFVEKMSDAYDALIKAFHERLLV